MKQKDKNSNQTVRKNIVKDIFTRPKAEKEKISAIFTHYRHSPKIIPPSPQKEAPSLRPLPAAIDIGASGIKLFQLGEGEKGELEIICIDEEGLPAAADNDPTVSIKSALKKITSRNETGPLCTTTLSTKDVQFYNMLFPQMQEDELIAAIRYKVTQLRPFDLDIEELIIKFSKWEGMGAVSATSSQRVIVACTHRDTVKKTVSLLQGAGLKPVKIGILPFDLINLSRFYKAREVKNEVTLWIDMGETGTLLAIEKGGSLCFSRNLSLSSKNMTKALAGHRGVTEEEAEKAKRNYGLVFWAADKKISPFYESGESPDKADKSEAVYYGLVAHLENLVVDIMHSFKYFSYQVTQSEIAKFDRVVLCGGGANLTNLDRFLSARLGVPVECANPFALFGLSDAMKSRQKRLIPASSNFAVCAGMAAGQKIEIPRQINLLAEEEKRRIQVLSTALKQKPVLATAVVVMLGISLLGIQAVRSGHYKGKMNSLTRQVKTTKAQLGNMQARQLSLGKEAADLLNKKALLEARLGLVRGGLRRPEDFSGFLTSISELLPEDIWITSLSYKEDRLTITGSTADMGLIAALIGYIKSSDEFMDADFNYTEKDPVQGVYNFEIVADVRT